MTSLDRAWMSDEPDAPVFEAARALGEVLLAANWRVATAESCTGGLVARALTEIGGSSQWFDCSTVTYSNDAKVQWLGVSPETLSAHGAVSEPVAREMAQGLLARSRLRSQSSSPVQLALAITGIAGPAGGSPAKPVGTVCFAWASSERVEVATRHFPGGRAQVRRLAAIHVLEQALALVPCSGRALV
jgi:nicotinamide-nucleotide amidase